MAQTLMGPGNDLVRVDLREAASLAGIAESRLKNWIYVYGLFDREGPGSGFRLSFGFSEVLAIAGIRSLVEQAGLTSKQAVEAIKPNPHAIWGALKEGRSFVISRNADGRWVGASSLGRVEIHLSCSKSWEEMEPRWAERYPGPVELLKAQLEDLRAGREPRSS